MRWTPLGLVVAALLAVSARAASDPAVLDPAAAAGAEASKPTPELVRLDQELTKIQEANEHGRFTSEQFVEILNRFRAELDVAQDDAARSPANIALHARILARLGKFKEASEALGKALRHDPDDLSLHVALSQVRFDERNYPAALAEADAALKRDPENKEALTLKHFSEGRVAMNDEAAHDRSPAPGRRAPPHRFHFAAADTAKLPFKLPVKMSPAAAPPELILSGKAPTAPGPLPLLPLAAAAAMGLAAYEVSRSRGAYASTEGLDDDHPKPVGRYQRLVAGTILAGAFGAVVYLSGAAIVSAAPVILNYATVAGNQGLRLASSEAGSINPGSIGKSENAVPQAEAAIVETEQIVIKKGEILNRVWHSEWSKGSNLSGPEGFSYCRGACLPIHAARAVEGRGLDVGVINNARAGGLYRVTDDIVVLVRQSIGGYDEEILLRSPADIQKLQLLREHLSSIPVGNK